MIKPHKYHKNPENQHTIYPNNCMTSSKTLFPPYSFGCRLFDQLLMLQWFVFFPAKRTIIHFFLTCLVKMYLFLIAYEFFITLYIIECHAILRIVFKFVKASKRFLKYTSKIQKNFTQTSSGFICFITKGSSPTPGLGCCQACSDPMCSGLVAPQAREQKSIPGSHSYIGTGSNDLVMYRSNKPYCNHCSFTSFPID